MRNKRVIIAWIALIAWMALIFFMSNQPGDVSSKQSDLVLKLFSLIGIKLNDTFGEFATLIVRKGAHFSEYFILYLLGFNLLINYCNKKRALFYSIILIVGYAISDEIHQYFIPGRAMAFKDVLIDSCGGVTAMFITYIGINRKEKKKNILNEKLVS